jgi:hypothetical protein
MRTSWNEEDSARSDAISVRSVLRRKAYKLKGLYESRLPRYRNKLRWNIRE